MGRSPNFSAQAAKRSDGPGFIPDGPGIGWTVRLGSRTVRLGRKMLLMSGAYFRTVRRPVRTVQGAPRWSDLKPGRPTPGARCPSLRLLAAPLLVRLALVPWLPLVGCLLRHARISSNLYLGNAS